MSESSILQAVKDSSKDGKISCTQALILADLMGVEPKEIGKAANQLQIKIVKCQLGCF